MGECLLVEEDDEVRALFEPTTPSFVATPKILHGISLASSIFSLSATPDALASQLSDALLERVAMQVLGSDVGDDDWQRATISSAGGLYGAAVTYKYPTNYNKKFFACLNPECGINTRVDARLLGIAATIHAHVYLAERSEGYEVGRRHMNTASGLREYCYQAAGKAGFADFTEALFDLLCADLLEDES